MKLGLRTIFRALRERSKNGHQKRCRSLIHNRKQTDYWPFRILLFRKLTIQPSDRPLDAENIQETYMRFHRTVIFSSLLAILLLPAKFAAAQAGSDSQALTLAAQAQQAMTHGVAISDVTLTGTATQTAGSWSNTGSATFKAKGTAESRLDFSAAGLHPEVQVQSEIRALDSSGHPTGTWARPDGVKHAVALHNAFTDAAWFFPALGSLGTASQSGVVAKYIGAETHNGVAVQHLRLWRTADASLSAIAGVVPGLSTVDIYLDSSSALPVALAFNAHGDKDMNTNVPIEVRYADWRTVSGITAPFHVQEYLNKSLIMDFEASQVTINSGLADTEFQ
jgi:hypothetical protein